VSVRATAGGPEHVVFTRPCVLREWRAYLAHTLPGASRAAYERQLKYGPRCSYWNEYVFDASVNHEAGVIHLAGLPDVAESR
jgi:hypothetical protein